MIAKLLRCVAELKDVTSSLLSSHTHYDFNAANFQCHEMNANENARYNRNEFE